MTRNLAGTTSSRSETSSPVSTFCFPSCPGRSFGSITTSTHSRCGAKPLRDRCGHLPPARSSPLLTSDLIAAMPVSNFLKTKACCSLSVEPNFSDRRPKRARSNALQDMRQLPDAYIGIGVLRLEIGDLCFQSICGAMPFQPWQVQHAFSALASSGSLRSGASIRINRAHFAPFYLSFPAADSIRRKPFPSSLIF